MNEEDLRQKIEKMQEERGMKDGAAGFAPSEASSPYIKGYMLGKERLRQKRIQNRVCTACGQELLQ